MRYSTQVFELRKSIRFDQGCFEAHLRLALRRALAIKVRLLNVRNQSPLRAGVAVDVALGGFDRPMPREQLLIPEEAATLFRDDAAPRNGMMPGRGLT
jgi:hypothetical protein